jgi:excisionase family DNA binding protein
MATKPQAGKRLLRTRQAAEYLGVSPWTLRRLVQDGRIPVVQVGEGSPWLVDLSDLDRFIAEHKKASPYDLSRG